ncbi:hypothetical protein P9112_001640 [Eukaryota sp. TZLM1-RC]
MSIKSYSVELSNAIQTFDGKSLSRLLSLRHTHASPFRSSIISTFTNNTISDVLSSNLSVSEQTEEWSNIISSFIEAFHHYYHNSFQECYTSLSSMVSSILTVFHYWNLSFVRTFTSELKSIAIKTKSSDVLDDVSSLLFRFSQACNADKGPVETSKQWLYLHLSNVLLAVYFQSNSLGLAKSVLRPWETVSVIPLDDYPLIDRVTFCYYSGRIYLYRGKFRLAHERLSFCFGKLTISDSKRATLCSYYYVFAALLHGKSPSTSLLSRLNMDFLSSFIMTVRRGDVVGYVEWGRSHEKLLLKTGCFVVYSTLELVVLRNLFKNVVGYHTPKLLFSRLQMAYQYSSSRHVGQNDDDIDPQVICQVSRLFSEGFVKGYVSVPHKAIVLSKQDPFPKLSGRKM